VPKPDRRKAGYIGIRRINMKMDLYRPYIVSVCYRRETELQRNKFSEEVITHYTFTAY
jgi:hypothetical protein